MNINPYLHFDGTCAEAFAFYADVTGGKIGMRMTYGEGPPEIGATAETGHLMMHMQMTIGTSVLMGADTPPGRGTPAAGFAISLNLNDLAEAERVYGRLSEGGKVMMPLQKTFWARGFAMFTDRFGTPWMINCE